MEIRLHKLILSKFMGGSFDLDANSEDVNIYGANGSGKTRISNSFSWLLFNKDSLGRADFEIKNLDAHGDQEHGLDHSVEGAFFVDGSMMVLKKTYREIWSKKRGNPRPVLTGNTTDHFLDGVPVQKKDYDARVVEMAGDESVFRLLTSPVFFPSLHWTKQRQLLLEVCGDMTDAQVIESDGALAPLTDLLKRFEKSKKPFDDLKAVIVARRSEINKALEQIPVRIDEVHKGLPNIDGLDTQVIHHKISLLETFLNDTKMKLHGIDNGASIAELAKKLAGINADIQQAEQAHYNGHMSIANRINQELTALINAKSNGERRAKSISAEIESKQSRLTVIETQLQQLRDRWAAIDLEQFKNTIDDTCPACGQPLPSDRVEEAREKARAEFNENKALRLTDIEARGKILISEKDRITAELVTLGEQTRIEKQDFDTDISQLTANYNAARERAKDYTDVAGRDDLIVIKASLERDIREARESVAVDRDAIAEEIASLNEQLKNEKNKADLFPKRVQGEARIAELKDEEKHLATEFEKLEKELYLCESFIKAKVHMLTEKINAKFEIARFKLFDVQVNGGISECCVLTIMGVPYDGGLNSAARIQGGLDIIRTLQRHYSMECPVWIDNRESCTEIPKMSCQVLSLYVSPEDAVLRVETPEKKRRMGIAI